jgi:hypothetical protein
MEHQARVLVSSFRCAREATGPEEIAAEAQQGLERRHPGGVPHARKRQPNYQKTECQALDSGATVP